MHEMEMETAASGRNGKRCASASGHNTLEQIDEALAATRRDCESDSVINKKSFQFLFHIAHHDRPTRYIADGSS